MIKEKLFQDYDRTNSTAKGQLESRFEFLDRMAHPIADNERKLLNTFFERTPDEAKSDLRARLKSKRDHSFYSAVFEMLISFSLQAAGHTLIDNDPIINGGTPDFLMQSKGGLRYYLEATVALPSEEKQRKDANLSIIKRSIEEICVGRGVIITIASCPATPVRKAELKRAILPVLKSGEAGRQEDVSINVEGFSATIRCYGSSSDFEGIAWVGPAESGQLGGNLAAKIRKKASKYNSTDQPVVLAVTFAKSLSYGMQDLFSALLGAPQATFSLTESDVQTSEWTRTFTGALVKDGTARHKMISAIVFVSSVDLASIHSAKLTLVHNPWARNRLSAGFLPFDEWYVSETRNELLYRKGVALTEFFEPTC